MKLKRKLLKTKIFVLLLALTNVVSAQQNSISGRVLDNENKPLPGATIVVKGTTVGTVSESDGTFQLQIPSDAETLVISFVGMVTQEIPIEGKSNFEIILRTEAYGLDEVLVTC